MKLSSHSVSRAIKLAAFALLALTACDSVCPDTRAGQASTFFIELKSWLTDDKTEYIVEILPTPRIAEGCEADAFSRINWYISAADGHDVGKRYELTRLVKAGVDEEYQDIIYKASPTLVELFPKLADFTLKTENYASEETCKPWIANALGGLMLVAKGGQCRIELRCVPYFKSVEDHKHNESWSGDERDGWLTSILEPLPVDSTHFWMGHPHLTCSS